MNLPAWAREGSVAAGMTIITCINLYVEGGATAATAMFQVMSVLITMLFVNVVMRLRFPYAVSATMLMAIAGTWFATHAPGLKPPEQVVGLSMMTLGAVMTLTAAYSLERQERLNFLLYLSSAMQSMELHRLSNIDRLTELPNRRAFDQRFEELWREGIGSQTQLSVIVIDIDHFKVVNDVYGHLYGDEVLRHVAALLPTALRSQDMAARFGGEEFVILLPEMNQKAAIDVAERVRSLVEENGTPARDKGQDEEVLTVTVSCGVSTCVPDRHMVQEKLLKIADRALYKAKEEGRNRVEFRRYDLTPEAEKTASSRASSVRRLAKLRDLNRYR
jgi:diguanylate cyclase (GGDEF)-like protein